MTCRSIAPVLWFTLALGCGARSPLGLDDSARPREDDGGLDGGNARADAGPEAPDTGVADPGVDAAIIDDRDDAGPAEPDGGPDVVDDDYVLALDLQPSSIRGVDLLFVIDDSGSMGEEQASLAEWSEDLLFGALTTDSANRLDLHVAVVSTNLGAGPYPISGCGGGGNRGIMSNVPRGFGCSGPSDHYIIDVDDGAGGRYRNYEGTLAETFACIAQLGTAGCGFEQPLESMRRALDGSNPENAGFLRGDALLAVVIVSDEDDCSVSDTAMFDSSQTAISDPLGPLSSFRCFEFGVQCSPDSPREPGQRSACTPRRGSRYMPPVSEYASFLRELKADPGMIVVAGIIGDPSEQVSVELDERGQPRLVESCTSDHGVAAPGIRLDAFLDAFPDRNEQASICSDDIRAPLSDVAARITDTATRAPCLRGAFADTDPVTAGTQPSCRVSLRMPSGATSAVPSCAEAPRATCFAIAPDSDTCGHTTTQLAVTIRGAVPPGAHTVDECRAP